MNSTGSTSGLPNRCRMRRWTSFIERQGEVQEKLDAAECVGPGFPNRNGHGCPEVPSGRNAGQRALRAAKNGAWHSAACLLQEPDILLLDEPTNHLDAESVAWLEHHLQRYPGTVIAVTHDRYFLDNVAGWILELDRGQGIPWQGNYSSWLEQKVRG